MRRWKGVGFRPPNKLLSLVIERMGVNDRAWRTVILIHEWAIAQAELGLLELPVETFVAWSVDSRATTHRRLYDFRQAFPEANTPGDLIHWPDGLPDRDQVDSIEWRVAVA